METLTARQALDALRFEVQTLDKKLQHANSLVDLYNVKTLRLDDQARKRASSMKRANNSKILE